MEIQGKIQDLQWACPDLQVTDRQTDKQNIQEICQVSKFTKNVSFTFHSLRSFFLLLTLFQHHQRGLSQPVVVDM